MAKDRRRSSQTSQTPNVKAKMDNVIGRQSCLQKGSMVEPHAHLDTETPKAFSERSRKLDKKNNLECLKILIDSSNRIFLLQKESNEPLECCWLPSGLAASLRRQILLAAEKPELDENVIQAPLGNCDRVDLEIDQDDMLTVDCHSSKSKPKKRRPVPVKTCPTKRRRSSHVAQAKSKKGSDRPEGHGDYTEEVEGDEEQEEDDEEDEEEFTGVSFEKRDMRVCDLGPVMEDIMMNLQQKGLKRILKVWLGKCHPQKQATFPYNGGKIQEYMRKTRDPAYDSRNPGLLTAPDYWYSQDDWSADRNRIGTGVRHKEPDHLLKHERVTLCKHLLHAGDRYNDAKFDLDKMEESTMNVEKEHPRDFRPDARRLIDSLYYARRKEIEYENGEIDADTTVYVEMKIPPSPRPKRRTRARKKATKVKQSTPELAGFFDLTGIVNPSPSANSSFTAAFDKSTRIESGCSTPLPCTLSNATSLRSHAMLPPIYTTMKRIASQNSSRDSHPSTVAGEGRDAVQHSTENTPPPSEADTETNQSDMVFEPDQQHDGPKSQRMEIHPGSQQETDLPSPTLVVAARPNSIPSFRRDLLDAQYHGQFYPVSKTQQQAATIGSSTYINPAATTYFPASHIDKTNSTGRKNNGYNNCSRSEVSLSPHQGYTNSVHNNQQQPTTTSPAIYIPYPPHSGTSNQPDHSSQSLAHSPSLKAPVLNPSAAAPAAVHHQTLLPGYPSGASSDFNGAMPINSEWHTVDYTYGYFRDGTYQQEQNAASMAASAATMPAVTSEQHHNQQLQHQQQPQQATHEEKDLNDAGMGAPGVYWATEWDAMAHDPRRYLSVVQPQPQQLQMQGMGPSSVIPVGAGGEHEGAEGTHRIEGGYEYPSSLGRKC